MMSGIRAKNTKPELMIRKALHARGFRYRLYDPKVLGKPDLVLPKWKTVIFINGCFWHGHDCHLHKLPTTRTAFWREKLQKNRDRDKRVRESLREAGWRVLIIWECALRGRGKIGVDQVIDCIVEWLKGDFASSEIRGAA